MNSAFNFYSGMYQAVKSKTVKEINKKDSNPCKMFCYNKKALAEADAVSCS
jgi:hypothetical protein